MPVSALSCKISAIRHPAADPPRSAQPTDVTAVTPRDTPSTPAPNVAETWLPDLVRQSSRDLLLINEASLTIIAASDAACRTLHYAPGALAGQAADALLPELPGQPLERVIARLRDGATAETLVPTTLASADGRRVAGRLRISRLPLQGGMALMCVIEVERSAGTGEPPVNPEERLAQIEAHVPGLLFQLQRRRAGGLQFCFLSQACQDLLGHPVEALYAQAQRFLDQIVEQDRQALAVKMRHSAYALDVLNWEGRIWIESWQDFKWINLRATPRTDSDGNVLWTGLMTNITQGKRQADEVRQSHAQLAELSAYVEQVREQERERIERDLHDDLGGNLSALKMMLGHVWKQLEPTPFLQERSAYLNQLIDRSIESIHRISADLRPGILDAGLVAALEWLAQEQQRQTGVPYQLCSESQDIDMPPSLATSLFRIAQEACNNVRKHAQATRVDIRLSESDGELVLEVADNGIGISEEKRKNSRSFGLLGMSERMSALGGSFHLSSRSGQGTTVRVTLPLQPD